jgi:hypothetical protein
MNSDLRNFIQEARFHRASVERVAEMLPANDAELDGWIAEAVAGNDLMAFMFLVTAALSRERPVDARHLAGGARLLPAPEYLASIVWRMHGDVAEHLIEGIHNTVMYGLCEAAALFVTAAWCEEHRGGVLPERLIPTARALARRAKDNTDVFGFLVALALRTNDAALNALLKQRFPGVTDAKWKDLENKCRKLGDEILVACHRPILDAVPDEPADQGATAGTMRRAVPRIGRNEPCHCGSGKKYKNCCYVKDQERLQQSSDVAGLTQRELDAAPEPHLTAARMEKTGPLEVARLDPTKIPRSLLHSYFLRLSAFHLFDRAIESFEKLGYADDLEEAWGLVMFAAVREGRKDIGERLMKLREISGFTEEKLDLSEKLLLAQDDPAKSLRLIEEAARKALQTEESEELLGLAYAVAFSKFSALGILLYRGTIPLVTPEQAAISYEQLLIVRDRLNLPPDDPISDLIDTGLARYKDESKDAAALREAQEKFEAKRREVRALKESMERLQKEIARREQTPPPAPAASAPVAPVDKGVLRELREKVERLQSALKERHDERNALRRDLQKTQSDLDELRRNSAAASAANDTDADNEEDLLLPQETEGTQPVRIIEFPRNFQERLNEFPRHVARATMSTLGRIAAGEPAAFVGAVRLKACPTVMRQRIGIDFRLLFRLLPDRVKVVDLIPRQDLERKIKTLIAP